MENRPLYWFEGLFLRPQHFQQQDVYHSVLTYDYFKFHMPNFWGVHEFECAHKALSNNTFEIQRCQFLFPDSVYASHPGNIQISHRSFEGKWDKSGKPLSVYVGLKKFSHGDNNISNPEKSATGQQQETRSQRYWLPDKAVPVYDLYADQHQESLHFLQYHLVVFFEDERQQAVDYHLIKVAELELNGNEVRVSQSYIPPVLTIASSQNLQRVLRDLKEQLTARCHELALYKKELGESEAMMGRDFGYMLALRSLNRFVPLIHHHIEQGSMTPWDFYGLLRQIVGELSTFSMDFDVFGSTTGAKKPDGLPEYSHIDIAGCYNRAISRITLMLSELTAGPDYTQKLGYDGTYYGAELAQRIFQGNNRYFIRLRLEPGHEYIIQNLQSTAKVSAREYLPMLIARALPGVQVGFMPNPPNELPRRADSTYFEVDPRGDAWTAIRNGNNIAIYFDNAPGEDVDMELLVIYG